MATLQQLQGLESRLAALENRESWTVCMDTLASDHHELLHLRANQAKQLAQCTMSEADRITVMREGKWL